MQEAPLFIIAILVTVAVLYVSWKIRLQIAYRTAKKSDKALIKMYNQTAEGQRLTWSIVMFFFVGPLAVGYYYVSKRQLKIIENALKSRNIKFEYKE